VDGPREKYFRIVSGDHSNPIEYQLRWEIKPVIWKIDTYTIM